MAEQVGHAAQGIVPASVSHGVINAFEIIQIHKQQDCPRTGGGFQETADFPGYGLPVVKPGKGIHPGIL